MTKLSREEIDEICGARPRTEVPWINPACASALDREKRSLHTLMAGAE